MPRSAGSTSDGTPAKKVAQKNVGANPVTTKCAIERKSQKASQVL